MAREIAVTYENLLRVWWAYTWRFLALGAVNAALIGMLMAFLVRVAGVPLEMTHKITPVLAFIAGVAASQWVMHRLLTRGFGRFRLGLIEK